MKHSKRTIIGILLAGILVCCCQCVLVKAEEATPFYIDTNNCAVYLAYSGNTANCSVYVKGKSGTKSITGTLKLRDKTAKKTVKKWTISKTGISYSGSKTATVQAGHKYKLSFSGTVYNSNGIGEAVSVSVTKSN